MMKIEGSGSASGSISQRHGSADPDPHQNVMDPQYCMSIRASFAHREREHFHADLDHRVSTPTPTIPLSEGSQVEFI
jgi:hypothetical protein